jgi:hypothetical protein
VQVEEGRVRKEEQELSQSEMAFDTFLQGGLITMYLFVF